MTLYGTCRDPLQVQHYQNIGCKFNKGCIIFLICKNDRLKLQYLCIHRYQSYHQKFPLFSRYYNNWQQTDPSQIYSWKIPFFLFSLSTLLFPFTAILMGLSCSITVHCGTSFTNEQCTKSSKHPVRPKILKMKFNRNRMSIYPVCISFHCLFYKLSSHHVQCWAFRSDKISTCCWKMMSTWNSLEGMMLGRMKIVQMWFRC